MFVVACLIAGLGGYVIADVFEKAPFIVRLAGVLVWALLIGQVFL